MTFHDTSPGGSSSKAMPGRDSRPPNPPSQATEGALEAGCAAPSFVMPGLVPGMTVERVREASRARGARNGVALKPGGNGTGETPDHDKT